MLKILSVTTGLFRLGKQQKGCLSLTQPCANSAWSALFQDITTNQDTTRRASEPLLSASLPCFARNVPWKPANLAWWCEAVIAVIGKPQLRVPDSLHPFHFSQPSCSTPSQWPPSFTSSLITSTRIPPAFLLIAKKLEGPTFWRKMLHRLDADRVHSCPGLRHSNYALVGSGTDAK